MVSAKKQELSVDVSLTVTVRLQSWSTGPIQKRLEYLNTTHIKTCKYGTGGLKIQKFPFSVKSK